MLSRKEHRKQIRYICQIGAMPTRRQIRKAYRNYRKMVTA